MADRLVPELLVGDVSAAERQLCDVFGFAREGGLLRLGSQSIAVRQGADGQNAGFSGAIDHLALSVPDLDTAAAAMCALGAVVDATTPDGPKLIPEFWEGGMRYLFLRGPEGARIELCHNLARPQPLGHDHIGIPCSDIAASQAFAESVGARLISAVALSRPGGVTQVRFLELAGAMLEFYSAPETGPASGPVPPSATHIGRWSRLLVPGLSSAMTGPDGLILAPL